MSASRASLSVVILTLNEERNIASCLDSLKPLAPAVFLVDSGSTDATRTIARARGASVATHPFETHAAQWNWALRSLPIETDWVLCLDADQRVSPELAADLMRRFQHDAAELQPYDGMYVIRRQMFRGRWIRHGGYYPKRLLKLVRRSAAWSDEHERLDFRLYVCGRTGLLRGDLIEDNANEAEIAFWTSKHIRFARLQADEECARRTADPGWSIRPSWFGSPDARTIWLKTIWYRLPLYLRPFVYFFYRYVLRLGFLDGKQGFVFHFLQAFWYRLMVDIMIDERRAAGSKPSEEPAQAVTVNRAS